MKSLLLYIFLVFSTNTFYGLVYEGFDLKAKKNAAFGQESTLGGLTDQGWYSAWQSHGTGKSLFNKKDLTLKGLNSVGGSAKVLGERKPNHIGKGYMIRQINEVFEDTAYGSFRVKPGYMSNDSIFGLLFTANLDDVNPRTSFFSICPKRFGSDLGVVGVGKKTYKISGGVACVKDSTYLVLWKMSSLPKAGDVGDISVRMWVLNEKQVAYFSKNNFKEIDLNLAEPGDKENQVCQHGRMNVIESKFSLVRGLVLVPYNYNLPSVTFDEIRISSKGFPEAVGL